MSSTSPPAQIVERMNVLRREIDRHNELYYTHAQPEISDREFDQLLKELNDLEASYPALASNDSPTQRVGGRPTTQFPTVTHRIPMLSMDNTYDLDELREFDDRVRRWLDDQAPRYTVEPKIDGVSLSVTYDNGRLALAATRGDGRQGDDVTQNVLTIKSLPHVLHGSFPPVVEFRGEVFFDKLDFARINESREEAGELTFANPRNAAAGTIKMIDSRIVASRPLRIFLYALGYSEGLSIDNQMEALAQIEQWGLPVVPGVKPFDDLEALLEHVQQWEHKRHELEFEVDGLVIKVLDFKQREMLGARSKSPRWQVAYKYAAEQATTRVENIDIQVGKTGKLTPVAHLTPVLLSGTTVSRAGLHNDEEIKRRDIRIGDMVVVEKAGEIIPQVVRVDIAQRQPGCEPFVFPTHCPVCQHPAERDPGGVAIRCVNVECPARIKGAIEFFAHRSAMDIEGLGPALVEQLYESGLVRRLPDLYRLTSQQLQSLERMGKKSADNLLTHLENSKKRGLIPLLVALGIRHVGTRGAQVLGEHFGSMDAIRASDLESLANVPEVGPVMAQSVYDFFHRQGGDRLVDDLAAVGIQTIHDRPVSNQEQIFDGKTIVVTGTLIHYSRDEIEKRIAELGGRPSKSVSKQTSFVVAGEKAGSKLAKAQTAGVKVISEEEFRLLVGDA